MLDIEYILKDLREEWYGHGDYRYNTYALTNLKYSGGNIQFCCPHHPENNSSCGISISDPYLYNCFTCGAKGTVKDLIKFVLNLRTERQVDRYLYEGYEEEETFKLKRLKKKINSEADIESYKGKFHSYLYGRGFDKNTLRKYEIGFDEETNSIVMPIRDNNGKIRFVKKRNIFIKKFDNATDIPKKDILYGYYYLKDKRFKEIYLTEAELDTMSCYQKGLPSVSVMGKTLFDEQIQTLKRYDKVILFYDNDLWGMWGAYQAYEKLNKHGIIVYKVLFPENNFGIDTIKECDIMYKDANDMLKLNRFDYTIIQYVKYRTMLNWNVRELVGEYKKGISTKFKDNGIFTEK